MSSCRRQRRCESPEEDQTVLESKRSEPGGTSAFPGHRWSC